MKILYIGHYKEASGWANVARDQILALDAAGVDVVARNITLTQDHTIPPRLQQLEQKSEEGCDICIQHVLPHHLSHNYDMYNIAFTEMETVNFQHLEWVQFLFLMDEVWVPNQTLCGEMCRVLDGRKKPHDKKVLVTLIHHPCDLEKYTKKYEDLVIGPAEGTFKFYYIGDLADRKNIDSIIRCFHSEFHPSEPVSMIFKVKKFGHSAEDTKRLLDEKIMNVKASLRLYPNLEDYKKDIVIADTISDEDICRIHQSCNCFVAPSHGEAWSIPTFEAAAFGSAVIAPNFGGPIEFINRHCGELIDGVFQSCVCSDPAFPELFTGREMWFVPCEKHIREVMRDEFNRWQADPSEYVINQKKAGIGMARNFTYEVIGSKMKKRLEKIYEQNSMDSR